MEAIAASGLHSNVDSGNFRRHGTKKISEAWCQLPEFCSHCPVVRIDKDFSLLQIGNVGTSPQRRGYRSRKYGLQPEQSSGVGGKPGNPGVCLQ